MYQFKPATERILRMRERIRDRVVRYDSERARILTESYQKNEYVVPIIKRPLALYDLCEKMTILVDDDEIIVGNKGPYFSAPPNIRNGASADGSSMKLRQATGLSMRKKAFTLILRKKAYVCRSARRIMSI